MTLTGQIIGAALEVHTLLGPGFLESIYQQALVRELTLRGFNVETQIRVDVSYKDALVGRHRIDMVVNQLVVLELKAISGILDIHIAQTLSYLKATGMEVGLIFNFGAEKLTWKRLVKSSEGRELRELV